MITKKDLTKQYSISLNTVRDTLKACGLDTSKPEYTDEEITTKFDVARKMIVDEQKSYADVSIHFGVSVADELYLEDDDETEINQQPFIIDENDPLHSAILGNVHGYVQIATDNAVQAAMEQLPQMIDDSMRRLVQSGALNDIFRKMAQKRRGVPQNHPMGTTTIDTPAKRLAFSDDDDGYEERQWQP